MVVIIMLWIFELRCRIIWLNKNVYTVLVFVLGFAGYICGLFLFLFLVNLFLFFYSRWNNLFVLKSYHIDGVVLILIAILIIISFALFFFPI